MRYVNLEKWRGKRDDVALNPEAMRFVEKPAKSCVKCLFNGQWSTVCNMAESEAIKRGMPSCAAGFIYVEAPDQDERQLQIENAK